MDATFKAIADHALLVGFSDHINDAAHASVIALDKAISEQPPEGVIETVPALVNLLIRFDPVVTDHLALEAHIRGRIKHLVTEQLKGVTRRIPVCYEAPFAPDLDAVSSMTGLSPDAIIQAHLSGAFHVLMYGFAPGYAYLSGVPDAIQVPRKETPVRDVPAGSVIIAGPQCLITTLKMPTGWSIIGRSPAQIFTGDPQHPFLFDVGDQVRFDRIDLSTYAQLEKEHTHGRS